MDPAPGPEPAQPAMAVPAAEPDFAPTAPGTAVTLAAPESPAPSPAEGSSTPAARDDDAASEAPTEDKPKPRRKRYLPADASGVPKRRREDGPRSKDLFETAFFLIWHEKFSKLISVGKVAPLVPKEFEAALDSYADSPLLRSLLSRVLSALLSRPVDTSDAALVPALRSAIARHIDRDPALNDFWGTDNPMEGAETMAPFWALTAENKAKTFRYLAEWATAVGRIKTAVDVAYEDRESAANTLWVPRVGKDRNRNSFWRLEGFPRIWRETVAGRWSVISDNVADMRKFAETLATDKPAQERELRRKILEELAPNYEETEKRKNRAERRIQKLERQLAVVAAGPVRTTRSRPVSYNVDVDDREFEKMLKTPKKDAPPEKVFRDGFRKTRRGADTTELVELPSNWKDVGRPRDRRRISEEDGESTLAGTGEDGEAHDTEESDLDSVASMETEDEGAPPAKKASPGVSAPAGAIGA